MDVIDNIIAEVEQSTDRAQSIEIMLQKLANGFIACKSEAIRVFRLGEMVRNRAKELAAAAVKNA